MATLPTTKRISIEDVRGAPDWFMRFLDPLNTFFGAVYDAINGNLTYSDNIASQVRDINFTTLATYTSDDWTNISFPNLLSKRATGLAILQITEVQTNYTPIKKAVSLDWQDINGNIVLHFVSGLKNSTQYNLKVRVD